MTNAQIAAMWQVRVTPQIMAALRPDTLTTQPASQADAELCRCMLDAVPNLDTATQQAGMQACLQAPQAFADQLTAAGITAPCNGSGPWYRTTAGMVGIGLGAVAGLGLLAWAVR